VDKFSCFILVRQFFEISSATRLGSPLAGGFANSYLACLDQLQILRCDMHASNFHINSKKLFLFLQNVNGAPKNCFIYPDQYLCLNLFPPSQQRPSPSHGLNSQKTGRHVKMRGVYVFSSRAVFMLKRAKDMLLIQGSSTQRTSLLLSSSSELSLFSCSIAVSSSSYKEKESITKSRHFRLRYFLL
jgi:hypothetical protein